MKEGLKHFTRKAVVANLATIGFGHMFDFVMLDIQRPQVPIIGSNWPVPETVATDVADHTMVQGTLSFGAPLSVAFCRGPPFKGTPGFVWSIHDEKGEIRITAAGLARSANDYETKFTDNGFDQEETEIVEWDRPFKNLPRPSRYLEGNV